MTSSDQPNSTALVTGASRGFGRGIASALHGAGVPVVAVARNAELLASLEDELGGTLTTVVADAADPVVAGRLVEQYRPGTLVLNAGAPPLMRPIQHQSWQAFSRNWDVDVQQAFHWIREALLLPLRPESTVVTMSSGAAVAGSPLSGGYAGAKATIRFMTSYAGEESERSGLGIRFVSLLPKLTPATELGSMAVAAYAGRAGVDAGEFRDRLGSGLTPDEVGKAVVELVGSEDYVAGAYMLTPAGLSLAG
jgi:NAD(P)-dependent dehydrogenase (short-subunit alcohol dehydrogenase family)